MNRADVKSPRSAFGGENRKTPRGAAPDYEGRYPLWAFRIVDLGGPWCWSALGGEELRRVLQRLRELESMTWHAIGESGSHPAAGASSGFREGGVLRILWWDPEHQVCPALLKHT